MIDRLVQHTIGKSSSVERLEEKRGFKEEDLPLRVSDIKRASLKARTFFSQLVGDTTKVLHAEVVNWLNLHLSTAITELLEFRGDALLRLMLEVREALATRDAELILLIEDFAKLQGIDMQLLEAIIARPHQEGRGGCARCGPCSPAPRATSARSSTRCRPASISASRWMPLRAAARPMPSPTPRSNSSSPATSTRCGFRRLTSPSGCPRLMQSETVLRSAAERLYRV